MGTSGWSYASWRGDFYPEGLRRADELGHLSRRLTSVEVNGSFYSLQRPSSYRSWRDATPDDFVLAVKGGRFITHLKRLRDVEAPLANFFASGVLALGHKLGPVLWQLPESLSYDAGLVRDFYELLPRTTSAAAELASRHDDRLSGDRALTTCEVDQPVAHVLEFRHRSFCEDAALEQLREHDVGCVVADSDGRWPRAEAVTSGVVHVRLHGHTELYRSRYAARSLDAWAARCRRWAEEADVFVYFDNDAAGHAPHDAEALLERLR